MSDILPELGPLDRFLRPGIVGTRLPDDLLRQLHKANLEQILLIQSIIELLEGLWTEAERARRERRYRDAIATYNKLLEEATKAREKPGLAEQAKTGLEALTTPANLKAFVADAEAEPVWRQVLRENPQTMRAGLLDTFEPAFRASAADGKAKKEPTIPDVPAGQPVTLERLVSSFDAALVLPKIGFDQEDRRARLREQLLAFLIRLPIVTSTGLAECHLRLGLLGQAQELLDLATRQEAWEHAGLFDIYRFEIVNLWIVLRLTAANGFLRRGDIVNAEPELRALIVQSENGRFQLPAGAWPRIRPVLAPAVTELERVLTAINEWIETPGATIELKQGGQARFRLGTPAIRALVDAIGCSLDIARGRAIGQGDFRVAPVWRFDYLFQLATYFASQARGAEARAIEFAMQADTAKLTRQNLQDAAQLARIDEELAGIRVDEAVGSLTVVQENAAFSRARRQTAQQRLTGFNEIAHETAVYQALSASLGAGSDGVWTNVQPHVDRLRREGRTQGERGHLIGATTYIVATMSAQFERQNLAAQIAEADAAVAVSDAQTRVERSRLQYARTARVAAGLRHQSAKEYLASFERSAFSPELLAEMSRLLSEISDGHFENAFDTALRMQQAFNYEFRTRLRVIDPGNRPHGIEGRLASEQLIQMIDSFKAREIDLGDQRSAIVYWDLPLASLFPSAWSGFQRSGVLEFSVTPAMLDRTFPGLFNVGLLEARITFQGISKDFLRWSLTNSHVGAIRMLTDDPEEGLVGPPSPDGDGLSKIGRRYQSVETLLGSKLADDPTGLRFFESRETRKRALFESSSPFCNWRLIVRPELSGVDLRAIRGATVVFVIRGQHSEALADTRVKALRSAEAEAPEEKTLALSLRGIAPKAIEALQNGQEARFDILPRMATDDGVLQLIDDYEVQLQLRSFAIIVSLAGRPDIAASGLDVTPGVPRENGGTSVSSSAVKTDERGGIRSRGVPALAALTGAGHVPVGTFTLKIAGGTAVMDPKDIRDVGIVLHYAYKRGVLNAAPA